VPCAGAAPWPVARVSSPRGGGGGSVGGFGGWLLEALGTERWQSRGREESGRVLLRACVRAGSVTGPCFVTSCI
jgi:hypothetical protein